MIAEFSGSRASEIGLYFTIISFLFLTFATAIAFLGKTIKEKNISSQKFWRRITRIGWIVLGCIFIGGFFGVVGQISEHKSDEVARLRASNQVADLRTSLGERLIDLQNANADITSANTEIRRLNERIEELLTTPPVSLQSVHSDDYAFSIVNLGRQQERVNGKVDVISVIYPRVTFYESFDDWRNKRKGYSMLDAPYAIALKHPGIFFSAKGESFDFFSMNLKHVQEHVENISSEMKILGWMEWGDYFEQDIVVKAPTRMEICVHVRAFDEFGGEYNRYAVIRAFDTEYSGSSPVGYFPVYVHIDPFKYQECQGVYEEAVESGQLLERWSENGENAFLSQFANFRSPHDYESEHLQQLLRPEFGRQPTAE